ncbi:MAG: transketolase family protein [Patescibacteria group bacterium]|nr:MAG: transketolase family protein [Patescibacteria group bacterium]
MNQPVIYNVTQRTQGNMTNQDPKLSSKIFDEDIEKEPIRDGFGKGLVEAGERDPRVVALSADLTESTRTHWFKEKFPERYIEIGVAEQNLATVASGLANYGKIPFITSYAVFSPGRNNEQIRTTISLNNVPVKVVGAHAGISVGPDGATHQALEDIALMRVQPNMTVLVPCDSEEAQKATIAAAQHDGPVYIRLAREKTPKFTTQETSFEIGKAQIFFTPQEDVAIKAGIIACGPLLHNALMAAKAFEYGGIGVEVMNLSTIKPIDKKAIVAFAKKVGAVVTVEEHQVAGGMGSAVAEVLSGEYPVPMEFVGVQDMFGQSGTPEELIEHYGMGSSSIQKAVEKVIKRMG